MTTHSLSFASAWGYLSLLLAAAMTFILVTLKLDYLTKIRPWFLDQPFDWRRRSQFQAGKQTVKKVLEWPAHLAGVGVAGDIVIVNAVAAVAIVGMLAVAPIAAVVWLFAVLPHHWFWHNLAHWRQRRAAVRLPHLSKWDRRDALIGLALVTLTLAGVVGLEVFAVQHIAAGRVFQSPGQRSAELQAALPGVSIESLDLFAARRNRLLLDEERPYPVAAGTSIKVNFEPLQSTGKAWYGNSLKAEIIGQSNPETEYVEPDGTRDISSIDFAKISKTTTSGEVQPYLSVKFNELPAEWQHQTLSARAAMTLHYFRSGDGYKVGVERVFDFYVVSLDEVQVLRDHNARYRTGLAFVWSQLIMVPYLILAIAFFVRGVKYLR